MRDAAEPVDPVEDPGEQEHRDGGDERAANERRHVEEPVAGREQLGETVDDERGGDGPDQEEDGEDPPEPAGPVTGRGRIESCARASATAGIEPPVG